MRHDNVPVHSSQFIWLFLAQTLCSTRGAISLVQCNGAPLCDSTHSLTAASSSYSGNKISEAQKTSATPLSSASSFYTLSRDSFFL
jgi:hypothetical protein